MTTSNQLFINQFEQIHGRRLPVPTIETELSNQMSDRSSADKVRKIALATPLKRVANFFNHLVGSDVRHRERWATSHGAHIIERVTVPTTLHATSLFSHLRVTRRREYDAWLAAGSPHRFWETDRRPSWRVPRMPDFSTSEPMFSMYRSTATYMATKTKNTHVTTKYYLICDDIVNFFVLREWSRSGTTELRDRMWRLWGQGHNFNIPVEIELPLIANCVEVAVFLIKAYTQETILEDKEVLVIDKTLEDVTAIAEQEVYMPKFRFMESNDSPLEPMLRKVDNRKKPVTSTMGNANAARAQLYRPVFIKRIQNMVTDFEDLSALEGDDMSSDDESVLLESDLSNDHDQDFDAHVESEITLDSQVSEPPNKKAARRKPSIPRVKYQARSMVINHECHNVHSDVQSTPILKTVKRERVKHELSEMSFGEDVLSEISLGEDLSSN